MKEHVISVYESSALISREENGLVVLDGAASLTCLREFSHLAGTVVGQTGNRAQW